MDRIGLPTVTAASAVSGFGNDDAAAGFAPGGCASPPASRVVQGNHRSPGVRDRVSGDIPETLSGVVQIRGAECMDLHPHDLA